MPLYRGFRKEEPPEAGQTRRVVRPGETPPSEESESSSIAETKPVMERDGVGVKSSSSKVEPTRRVARSESAVRSRPEPAVKPRSEPPPPAEKPRLESPPPVTASVPVRDLLSNPAVGWLAIITGPGRGAVLSLNYGVNDIGRGSGVRIRLDFGDDQIAPGSQTVLIYAAIIYTARSRRFYVQSVGAETLLNGRPLRESTELTGGEILQLGQTRLRFVPLCGTDFDWRDGG